DALTVWTVEPHRTASAHTVGLATCASCDRSNGARTASPSGSAACPEYFFMVSPPSGRDERGPAPPVWTSSAGRTPAGSAHGLFGPRRVDKGLLRWFVRLAPNTGREPQLEAAEHERYPRDRPGD